MNRPALEARGASFRYDDRTLIDRVDLEVLYGEILTILGANGSGKSTLLRCLGGALALQEGVIWVDGTDIRRLDVAARARKVGFLFQAHHPTFPFTAHDVVLMGCTPRLNRFEGPSPRDRESASQTLAEIGLSHLENRPYTELSGGERQLVLLGRALQQRPDVLLLDEPTAQLDLGNQIRCLKLIHTLASRGIAVVMTSHDPNQAFLFPGRTVLMKRDRTLSVGQARDVITRESLTATYGVEVNVYGVSRPAGDLAICSAW